MKDRARVIGLAALVTACGPVGGNRSTPEPDISYRDEHYRMTYIIPTLLGGSSGFTCYSENLPILEPIDASHTQVTLGNVTCENNNRRYTSLEEVGVTPGKLTEIIIFNGEADKITVVSQ